MSFPIKKTNILFFPLHYINVPCASSVFSAQLSHSDKVSFCDQSSYVCVIIRCPLTIDLNDISSLTPSPILK